jgi:hypothetical protein
MSDTTLADDGYFGLCPHCHKVDGQFNVGRNHWFFCDEHRVKWCHAWNLFTVLESETEQREFYYSRGFNTYEEVEAFYPPPKELGVTSKKEESEPPLPDWGPIPF